MSSSLSCSTSTSTGAPLWAPPAIALASRATTRLCWALVSLSSRPRREASTSSSICCLWCISSQSCGSRRSSSSVSRCSSAVLCAASAISALVLSRRPSRSPSAARVRSSSARRRSRSASLFCRSAWMTSRSPCRARTTVRRTPTSAPMRSASSRRSEKAPSADERRLSSSSRAAVSSPSSAHSAATSARSSASCSRLATTRSRRFCRRRCFRSRSPRSCCACCSRSWRASLLREASAFPSSAALSFAATAASSMRKLCRRSPRSSSWPATCASSASTASSRSASLWILWPTACSSFTRRERSLLSCSEAAQTQTLTRALGAQAALPEVARPFGVPGCSGLAERLDCGGLPGSLVESGGLPGGRSLGWCSRPGLRGPWYPGRMAQGGGAAVD
mmetsp:Transcript_71657/g.221266  ORF Transcript_71657/g.221266 Transcript_71657/m.221266 type:complete len:392 (+) Transcript_71657:455-1630(+)